MRRTTPEQTREVPQAQFKRPPTRTLRFPSLIHTLPPFSSRPQMLRASTTTVRNSTRLARSFATVVDSVSGVKVAAIDNGQPTSAVTFLVKAGSRFENKPGVAHALKNFAFKVRQRLCLPYFHHILMLFSLRAEHQHALGLGNREGV